MQLRLSHPRLNDWWSPQRSSWALRGKHAFKWSLSLAEPHPCSISPWSPTSTIHTGGPKRHQYSCRAVMSWSDLACALIHTRSCQIRAPRDEPLWRRPGSQCFDSCGSGERFAWVAEYCSPYLGPLHIAKLYRSRKCFCDRSLMWLWLELW